MGQILGSRGSDSSNSVWDWKSSMIAWAHGEEVDGWVWACVLLSLPVFPCGRSGARAEPPSSHFVLIPVLFSLPVCSVNPALGLERSGPSTRIREPPW